MPTYSETCTQFLSSINAIPTRMYAICRRSKESLAAIGGAFGVEKHYTRFQDVLSDPVIDFLHINTRLGTHGARPNATCRARAPRNKTAHWSRRSYTRGLSANAVTTKSIRPHLKSLRFGDISVHGLSQTENLLKAHC